jgi:hypothetical protein
MMVPPPDSFPLRFCSSRRRGLPFLLKAAALPPVIALLLALSPHAPLKAEDESPSDLKCITCHSKEASWFGKGLHSKNGLDCVSCHGGDPALLEGACVGNSSFRGIPKGVEAVELCGSCHSDVEKMHQYGLDTDQYQLYRSSEHGRALYEKGDENVATCVSCHGAHGIGGVKDPRSPVYKQNIPATCSKCHSDPALMEPYGLPADTFDSYLAGEHGRRLFEDREVSSPACSDCHGSHGATPPKVKEIANVCGSCHRNTHEYFRQGPHRDLENQCTACHHHHKTRNLRGEPLTGTAEGLCGACHTKGDGGLEAAESLARAIGGLDRRIDETRHRIRETRSAGIFISEEEDYLEEAILILAEVEPMIHTAIAAPINDAVSRGEAVLDNIVDSLEVKRRAIRDRKIVTAIAAAAILFFCLVLYARIRLIEMRQPVIRNGEPIGDRDK